MEQKRDQEQERLLSCCCGKSSHLSIVVLSLRQQLSLGAQLYFSFSSALWSRSKEFVHNGSWGMAPMRKITAPIHLLCSLYGNNFPFDLSSTILLICTMTKIKRTMVAEESLLAFVENHCALLLLCSLCGNNFPFDLSSTLAFHLHSDLDQNKMFTMVAEEKLLAVV